MKVSRNKVFVLMLGLLMVAALVIVVLLQIQSGQVFAYAGMEVSDEDDNPSDDFVVFDYGEKVLAEFEFVSLNDNECKVRLSNKNEATTAIIPQYGEIGGKKYKVVEITANGFMSSNKLVKVFIPSSVKKIGNMAFANCAELQRIILSRVEEIGNNAFYKCPKLKELVIPNSVETIGSSILKSNNTNVYVRAENIGFLWNESWNAGNTGEIQTKSSYREQLELEPVYNNKTRSGEQTILGYNVASGQPGTDYYYVEEDEDNNIYIPAIYNDYEILAIDTLAFWDLEFDQLIIEYSPREILIGSYAFMDTKGVAIIINRPIEFRNWDESSDQSRPDNIFSMSGVSSIVLPDSITCLPQGIFSGCKNLANIYFTKPNENDTRQDLLNKVENLKSHYATGEVNLPNNANFDTIYESAFEQTTSIKRLNIYSNVKNVGTNAICLWNDDQLVHIYNEGPLEKYVSNKDGSFYGWHSNWHSSFENIEYEKEYHTIYFELNGGELDPNDENYKYVVFDQKIEYLPTPSKKNSQFCGWFDEFDVEYNESSIYNLHTDLILKAKWGYKITFAKEGGIGGDDEVIAIYGEPMPEAIQPFKANYNFNGYYTKPNGGGTKYYDGVLGDYEVMISVHDWNLESNTTLYAYWVYIETKISYNLNGGTNNPDNVTVCHYFDVIELKDPTKVGFKFTGWYVNGEKITTLTNRRESEIVLVAQWDKRINSITYGIGAGTTYMDLYQSTYTIELPASLNNVLRIEIESTVKQVHIYANQYKEYGIYIEINWRNTDLDLYIENVKIVAPNMYMSNSEGYKALAAITMESTNNSALNLYTFGQVVIIGASGWDNPNGIAKDGNYAINCPILNIVYAENLSLYGGDGGIGITDGRGAAPYHCNNEPSISDKVKLYYGKGRDILK